MKAKPMTFCGLALGVAMMVAASALRAQVCNGTPQRTSLAYSYEALSVGSSNGATLGLVGHRMAALLDGRVRSISNDQSGMEGLLRLTGVFGTSRLSVCPGLRLGLVHDTWDVRSGVTVTTNDVVTGAGVGVGYEQPVFRGVTVGPFVHVGYGFNAVAFSMSATNATTDVTGDTLSGVIADYGAVVQYRRFYAGYAASRAPGQARNNPRAARFMIGFTFRNRPVAK